MFLEYTDQAIFFRNSIEKHPHFVAKFFTHFGLREILVKVIKMFVFAVLSDILVTLVRSVG